MKGKHLTLAVAVVVVLAVAITVTEVSLRQTVGPEMATVTFFSNNANGYGCFLNYTYPLTGAPVCLSDNPSLDLPDNASVPLGSYGIVFFPFGTASNQATWLGTNNIQVTESGPYDVSSSYANITVRGDGAIAVFVLPDNSQRVPEFPPTGAMAFSALVASLYFLRRRRR
jgi:hypothetical protein